MKGVGSGVILALILSGCASGPASTRERSTLGGAAIGAGTGALIGSALGGKAGTGALIGAGIGALSGALLGDQLQKVEGERGAPAYPPPAPPASPQAAGPPPPSPQVVASRPAGDPTKGEFANRTPWMVRVYVNADPNNVEARTPVVLSANQVVPWGLDIGTHRIVARAYVKTQFGERLVGRFDRTIQIDPRRSGWFLQFQESDFSPLTLPGPAPSAKVVTVESTSAAVSTWTSNGPEGGEITALAIDPKTPTTVYAGTTDGFFKSVNSGASWSKAGLNNVFFVAALAIDPTTPTTLYAGTSYGVFKSTNGGGSWSVGNTGLAGAVSSLAIDPVTPTTLYAGTGGRSSGRNSGGVFKSTNGGENWSAVVTGLTGFVTGVSLAIDPLTPTTLYAGTDGGGIFKSTNGGGSWSVVNTGLPRHVGALAIDPLTPTTLYARPVGAGVFKSTNGGESWSPVNTGLTGPGVGALAIVGLGRKVARKAG